MFSSGITLDNSNRLIKNINNDIIIKLKIKYLFVKKNKYINSVHILFLSKLI